MQVIVKNALEEDKRVARYPKQASTSSSTESSPTTRPTKKQHSQEKSFMQLIYDNSLVRHKTKLENPLNNTLLISTTTSTKKPISKESLSISNSATLHGDGNTFTGSTLFEEDADYKEGSPPLTINELRVNNDPESFKRSIPKAAPKKPDHDSSEVIPHPRGGPDSHDVFKFGFEDQLPNRPSFTFNQPKASPHKYVREPLQSLPIRNRTSYSNSEPTSGPNLAYPKDKFRAQNNDNYQKGKYDNIVWNNLKKPNKETIPLYTKKKRRKPDYKKQTTLKKPYFKSYRLPSTHPLRSIIPKTARVVGIQSIKRNKAWLQGVNRHDRRPHIMTVEDFLKMYPNMNNIRGAIPVPISDKKHIRMIELLAAQPKENVKSYPGVETNHIGTPNHPKRQIKPNSVVSTTNAPYFKTIEESRSTINSKSKNTNLEDMLKELEMLIAERAEKRVIHFRSLKSSSPVGNELISEQENFLFPNDIHHLKHLKKHRSNESRIFTTAVPPIRPRGEGPSLRFTSTSIPTTESTLSYTASDIKIPTKTTDFATNTTSRKKKISPKLEFGFKPITTSPAFFFTTTTTTAPVRNSTFLFETSNDIGDSLITKLKSPDPYQTMFDSINGISQDSKLNFPSRYPRLIPPKSKVKQKKKSNNIPINTFASSDSYKSKPLVRENFDTVSDPFFFTTTTTAKPIVFSQKDLSFPTSGISSTLFDMRKFFFIPKKSKAKSTKNNFSFSSSSFAKSGNRRVWRKPQQHRRKYFPRISL